LGARGCRRPICSNTFRESFERRQRFHPVIVERRHGDAKVGGLLRRADSRHHLNIRMIGEKAQDGATDLSRGAGHQDSRFAAVIGQSPSFDGEALAASRRFVAELNQPMHPYGVGEARCVVRDLGDVARKGCIQVGKLEHR
jgi:hypothetical protein